MEKLEQIIETYRLTIQKAELELRNARKRIYYISLLRLVLFVGAIAGTIIFWPDGWLYISIFAILPFILFILKSASNLNGNLNCSKELEHYAS